MEGVSTTKTFDHFIITRFNVPVWWSDKNQDSKWTNKRFELFDNYCYPSVRSQSNKNFKWLVLFGPNTDKSRIEKYEGFMPVFMDFFDADVDDIHHTIHTGDTFYKNISLRLKDIILGESTRDYIITTRLDNDDLIHNKFVESIQDNFQLQALNMPHGYLWYKGSFYHRELPHNPFMSLIEKRESLKTIYGIPHWKADKFVTIKQICLQSRMWVQVIHDTNHTNHKYIEHTIKQKPVQIDILEFGIRESFLNSQKSLLYL